MDEDRTSVAAWMSPFPVTIDSEASLDQALEMLRTYKFRHLPVVEQNHVVGILSDRDVRRSTSFLPAERRLRARDGRKLPGPERVADAMTTPVQELAPSAKVAEAARRMARERIGAIPIVDGGELAGILTETDLLRAFLERCREERGACDDLVRYHMHQPLPDVDGHVPVEEALERLDRQVGHLAVLDHGRVAGIVSERDLIGGLAHARIRRAGGCAGGEPGEAPDDPLVVSRVMTREVLTVGPGETLSRCADGMLGFHVSAVPVVEDGVAVGIVTQRHVLEHFAGIA